MQAFILRRYGGPEAMALGESPRPAPAAEELLLEVRAAGLNPVDYKFREGQLRAVHRPELPLVMGNELAGVVVECGRRVTDFNVGDRVYARCEKLKMGAFAEFACVHQDVAARMPPGLSYEQAAGVPLAGLTALQTLRDVLDVRSGKRILITGGSGGVGTFAIQVAKHLGAEVTTTASAEGEELVRSLGADHVINYKRERFEDVSGGFDGALDLIGGDTLLRIFKAVKRGCRVVSIAGLPEPRTARRDLNRGAGLAALFWLASARIRLAAWRHGVDYRYYFMHASGDDLRECSRLIDDGVVRPVVDRTYSFAQIDEAMAYLEAGHAKGKVVVRMSGADPADPPTSNSSQSQSSCGAFLGGRCDLVARAAPLVHRASQWRRLRWTTFGKLQCGSLLLCVVLRGMKWIGARLGAHHLCAQAPRASPRHREDMALCIPLGVADCYYSFRGSKLNFDSPYAAGASASEVQF